MRFGLMACETRALYGNLGDAVQSIAAEPYLPRVDCFIEREILSSYNGDEKIFTIINGWFNFDSAKTFPTGSAIQPLWTSFHLTGEARDYLKVTPQLIEYFRQYQPISCRDKSTARFLNEMGIDAHLTGCLTLTLNRGDFVAPETKRQGVYFVDAPTTKQSKSKILGGRKIKFLSHHHRAKPLQYFISWQQELEKMKLYFKADKNYFQYKVALARKLLALYANAELVITSRIHVALPCLAFNTPVLFIYNKSGMVKKSNRSCVSLDDTRFDGLIEHFNKIDDIHFRENLASGAWDINGKLTHWSEIKNPNTHKPLAEKLKAQTQAAVANL